MIVFILSLLFFFFVFFFKHKTAYEMRISDWSSDVCSSELTNGALQQRNDSCRRCNSRQQSSSYPWRCCGGIREELQAPPMAGQVRSSRATIAYPRQATARAEGHPDRMMRK